MSSTAFPSQPMMRLDEATSLAAAQRPLQLQHTVPPPINHSTMVETQDQSLERQDMLALQQAHSVIQRRRQQSQPAVIRYQALCRRSICLQPMSSTNSALRVHLNPLRAWSRFRTSRFLAGDVPPPATLLLFAVGDFFATRVFDLEGQTLINELADYQPCTLDQWSALSALASREQLVSLCEDLAASGLICFS